MPPQLSDLVQIPQAFTRSVHIEHDLASDGNPYVITPMFRQLTHRVVEGLQSAGGNRAWTVIGPYGTGKSAAVLALVQLLADQASGELMHSLTEEDSALAGLVQNHTASNGPMMPLVVTGYRGPLTPAIHGAVVRAISKQSSNGTSNRLLEMAKACNPIDSKAVTSLLEALSQDYSWFLVIDELGKFLEYSGQQPDASDIYSLQLLAEMAARSVKHPVAILTVLHQAVERYGSNLLQMHRQELSKVQGRYEEIAFQQPTEQMLRLLASAIRLSGTEFQVQQLQKNAQTLALETWRLGLAPSRMAKQTFIDLMVSCAPLHPLTALLLGPLFRRIAQSERSLFAFLSSNEPFGFRSFLIQQSVDPSSLSFYPPDMLYDYVAATCGTSLFSDLQGRRWVQTDVALDRLKNPTLSEIRVVKLIGLMGAIGESGALNPSLDVVRHALLIPDTDEALALLSKRSILVYRRFTGAYRLWEGSDLDVDELVAEGSKHISDSTPLDVLLKEMLEPRPQLARRHSYLTGTLRFYEVEYHTPGTLTNALQSPLTDADGKLIYLLLERDDPNAVTGIASSSSHPAVVVVPLKVSPLLKAAALELRRLNWVRQNVPALADDEVARRELNARVFETGQIVRRELDDALRPANSALTVWHENALKSVHGRRGLNQLLTDVCDRVYSQAPVIRNELINRRQPSSNAVAARRNLLERMVLSAHQEQLAIIGHPPELSMYLSVLYSTGLHKMVGESAWAFSAPEPGSTIAPVWGAWRAFLEAAQGSRRSLKDLWEELASPPYGLKPGVIPVLLCAMLLERQLEVAVYENGTFVPELQIAEMERLSKSPERFEIRYCPLDGLRKEIFDELRHAGLTAGQDQRILAVIKPLVQFAGRLPQYSKSTKAISSSAQQVRYHLLTAREPEVLLFENLPRALGFAPVRSTDAGDSEMAQAYAAALKRAVQEIGRSYTDLLDHIGAHVADALLISGTVSQYRPLLRQRANRLSSDLSDLRLKGFGMRLSDSGFDDKSWVESIGTFVVGKPPASWTDEDRERFGVELQSLTRRFVSMEALTLELLQRTGMVENSVHAARISLTTSTGEGRECTVIITPEVQAKASQVSKQLINILRETDVQEGEAFRMAVVASLLKGLLP